VNATIGFEGLSAEIRKPRKLAPHARDTRQSEHENFFGIVKALQKKTARAYVLRCKPVREVELANSYGLAGAGAELAVA